MSGNIADQSASSVQPSTPPASEEPRLDEVDFFDIPALRKQQEEERKAREEAEADDGSWANRWDAPPTSGNPEDALPALDLGLPPVVIPGCVEGTEVSISGGCIVSIKHPSSAIWHFTYDRTAALLEFVDGQGRAWQRVGKNLLHHVVWRNDQGGEWAGEVQPLLDGRVLLRAGAGDWTEILADGICSRYCPGPGLPVVESDAQGPYRIEGSDLANTRMRLGAPDDDGFAEWMTGECLVETLRVAPRRNSLWLEKRDGVSLVYDLDGLRMEQPVRGPEDFERIFNKMLSRLDRDSDGYVFPEDIDVAAFNPAFTGEDIQVLAALKKKNYRDGAVGILKSIFDLAGTDRGLCATDVRNFQRRLQYGLAGISILDNDVVVEILNEIRGWSAAIQGTIGRDMLQKLVAELKKRKEPELVSVAQAVQELISWLNRLGLQQTNSRDLRTRVLADVELYRAVQAAMHAAYDALQIADTPTSRRLYGDDNSPETAICAAAVKAGPESTNHFFLCSLASLAASAPEVIEQMISCEEDGSYVVRFAGDRETAIKVAPPVEAQLGLYAQGGRFGTWVTIVESAFNEYCKTGFSTEKLKCASGLSWYGDSLVAELLTASEAKILSRWYGQTNYMSTSYSAELQYKINLMDKRALSELIATGHTVVLSTNHPEIAADESNNQDLALISCTETEVLLVNPLLNSAERYLSGPLPPHVYATADGALVLRIEDLPKFFFRAVGCQIPEADLSVRQFLSKLKQKEA